MSQTQPPPVTMLPLARLDPSDADRISSRFERRTEAVERYAEAMDRGEEFPPILVFKGAERSWISDGYLRVLAAKKAGRSHIAAVVRAGTFREAVLHAAACNARHGEPRTNADKRLAVQRVLGDPEGAKWARSRIAKHCQVSEGFVVGVQEYLKRNAEATAADLLAARIDCGRGGAGMPQTPARIAEPGTTKVPVKSREAVPVVPVPPSPAPPPVPTPPPVNSCAATAAPARSEPPAPTRAVPAINMHGVLDDPKRSRYEAPPTPAAPPVPAPPRRPDIASMDPDEAERAWERLRRAYRKTLRMGAVVGLPDIFAIAEWFRQDQAGRTGPDLHDSDEDGDDA